MNDNPDSPSLSTKPYLVRAIYEWAVDNGLTPQIMVDVTVDHVGVPLSYAKDGKIVLNMHPSSVQGLELGDEYVLFSARFSGRAEDITIPMDALMAIYARENGQGIVFQADGSGVTPPPKRDKKPEMSAITSDKPISSNKPKRDSSHLKVVK